MIKLITFTSFSLICLSVTLLIISCAEKNPIAVYPVVAREDRIPADAVKRTPETDQHPPIMHSTDFDEPVPMTLTINTAGAEDSPFITPDGNTLYFFFTPDVSVPPNEQLFDDVTGIWVS